SNVYELEFTKTTCLYYYDDAINPKLKIHQLDDGTIISEEQKVFRARIGGRDVTVDKPEGFRYATAWGNAVYAYTYTVSKHKFYKLVCSSTNGLNISFLRDIRNVDEGFHGVNGQYTGLSKRVINGKTHYYRWFDDIDKEGILVDVSEWDLAGMQLRTIRRGKLIYASENEAFVRELSSNILVINSRIPTENINDMLDSIPFVWFMQEDILRAWNAEYSKTEPLQVKAVSENRNDKFLVIKRVVDFVDGIITIVAKTTDDKNWYLMKAKLSIEMLVSGKCLPSQQKQIEQELARVKIEVN
ncbi:hypothetical protein PENTCL1PPCAC_518, partial [Pristionchus entomophagus]